MEVVIHSLRFDGSAAIATSVLKIYVSSKLGISFRQNSLVSVQN